MQEDTIAAIATGLGGSISIIRLSGPDALAVGTTVWQGGPEVSGQPRKLHLGKLIDSSGQPIDTGLCVYMPGPNSYTGEDVVELQTHGGPLAARKTLQALLAAGARHAEAGEFTKRAFINGKMDLTQAEAVADIISARSDMALHTANRQLAGHLGRKVDEALTNLTEVLAEVESRLDFVDEDLNFESTDWLQGKLSDALEKCQALLASSNEGEVLREGVRIVLAGSPNAGKSSLLNLILGRDRAIVSDIPGTTRDSLEEIAHVRGIPVHLTDTAGLRDSDCPIEQEGVTRSYTSIKGAQLVIRVLDSTRPVAEQTFSSDVPDKRVITIANKSDLPPHADFELNDDRVISFSAANGTGREALFDAIEKAVWQDTHHAEPDVAVNARHADLLREAVEQIALAQESILSEELELVAINLRTAIDAVGKITGRTVQPDILDYIFSNFCIGK